MITKESLEKGKEAALQGRPLREVHSIYTNSTSKFTNEEKTMHFWMGQPIETLSREELLEALEQVGKAYFENLERHKQELGLAMRIYKNSYE